MRTYIKILLLLEGFWFLLCSFIDILSKKSNPPDWYEYILMGLISLGFYAVIDAIEENKKP